MLFPMITEEIIKKESGQYDCKAIQRLRLERKGFREINNLDCLGSILELSLARNEITCISGLDTLVTLQKLDLSNNRISRISNLSALLCLQVLNLSANLVGSIECFKEITTLPDLRNLRLQGPKREETNPVCDDTKYPTTLLLLIPGLTELDGGSVEVLKSFLEVMGNPATDQTTVAIEEPEILPERWIPLDQLSTVGSLATKSGIQKNDLLSDQTSNDSSLERLMNSITEKLTVDCPKLLKAGENALKFATTASSEKT